eukprot:239469-Pleurochrysis_carterae.AAC.1
MIKHVHEIGGEDGVERADAPSTRGYVIVVPAFAGVHSLQTLNGVQSTRSCRRSNEHKRAQGSEG